MRAAQALISSRRSGKTWAAVGQAIRELSARQIEQLLVMRRLRAFSLETALGPYDEVYFNPNILTKLALRGLVESKVVRPKGGGQRTVYWLTHPGQLAADLLAEAAS